MNRATNDPPFSFQHIEKIIRQYLATTNKTNVKLLDLGCGSGALIGYLNRIAQAQNSTLSLEIYGLEVYEHAAGKTDFELNLLNQLNEFDPETPWETRIFLISSDEQWPFKADFFDIIITNHVVEHVMNLDLFFSNIYRVLRSGGISINLFPLKSTIWEAHLRLPIVHWINNHNTRQSLIELLSKVGIGKYRNHQQKLAVSHKIYAEYQSDYILFYTNYQRASFFHQMAKKHRLRSEFSYTTHFYLNKLSKLFTNRMINYSTKFPLLGTISFVPFSLLSSVTLILEKENTKKIGESQV